MCAFFFFSSRRRHTRLQGDWSSDVCSSDLVLTRAIGESDETSLLFKNDWHGRLGGRCYARVEPALCGKPTGSTFRYTRRQERARASIARNDTPEGLPA